MTPKDRHIRNRELAARAQRGDVAARDELVAHMGPMLLGLTRRWRRDQQTRDDMIQEGYLGVLRAIRDYDAARGLEFVGYATNWIKCFINRRHLRDRSIIMMPQHVGLDCIPGFDPAGHEALDEIPGSELADSIGRAIVLTSALSQLPPFECWLLCERYGLDRPASLDRRVYPESGPPAPGRPRKFHREIQDIAAQCGLSRYRVKQAIDDAMADLRGILGADATFAAAS